MSFLDKLERRFRWFSIPGLTLVIVAGQALAWFAALRGFIAGTDLIFVPANVIAGQWWRVFAFVLLPPAFGLSINAVLVNGFAWWLFYIMGSALEGYWGAFRYNLFLIAGYMLTVAAGFAFPFSMVTNLFIGGSVFLAFAYLNPDFQLAILLVIPVRIKWLALAAWIYGLVQFVLGGWPERLQLLAAVGNFFLFFGHDLWLTARMRSRRMSSDAARLAASRTAAGPRHRCRVCGKTDRTNPEMDFRYCSKCAGEQCYCPEHIFNHAHVTDETVAAEKEKRS